VNNKTLLCFDFGTKRIGVAVGQSITCTASPLQTIKVLNNKPDWGSVGRLIKEWAPDMLIVGIPLKMDNSKQVMTKAAEKFARQLKGRFNLPVYGMDERLSSYEATQRINKKTSIDPVAAQAILETWLTENNKISKHGKIKPNNE